MTLKRWQIRKALLRIVQEGSVDMSDMCSGRTSIMLPEKASFGRPMAKEKGAGQKQHGEEQLKATCL